MTQNPIKCKAMTVDVLLYNRCVLRPIVIGNAIVKRVASFKLLGVFISRDLTWDTHVDYILKKANKRLYILRILRRCGVEVPDMVKIYCAVIPSVLEYASPVFSNIPAFLSSALERIKSRALAIMMPGVSYLEALHETCLASLETRGAASCVNFMQSVKSDNPLFPLCRGLIANDDCNYNLWSRSFRRAPVNTVRFCIFSIV